MTQDDNEGFERFEGIDSLSIGEQQDVANIVLDEYGWRQRLHDYENVEAVGVGRETTGGDDTGRVTIVVYVHEKLPVGEIDEKEVIPTELYGVPVDVQESGGITYDIEPAEINEETDENPENTTNLTTRQLRHRPIFGGISGSGTDGTAGTLGGAFVDEDDEVVFLTNRHVVSADGSDPVGDQVVQPGPIDDDSLQVIGEVKDSASYDPDGTNTSDSATISVQNSANISDHVLGVGTIGSVESPNFEDTYVKSGRTTLLESSLLRGSNISATINSNAGHSLLYTGLLAFDPVSLGGDSGSLWGRYDRSNDRIHPVGLHFAGGASRALAIPWTQVEDTHGTLTPATTGIEPDHSDIEALHRVERCPLAYETDARGVLPFLFNRTGVQSHGDSVDVAVREGSSTGTVLHEFSLELGEAEKTVVDIPLSESLSSGDHRITVEPNYAAGINYDITVGPQTEFRQRISVVDGNSLDAVYDAEITVEEWLGGGSVGETIASGTTDDAGEFSLWAQTGTYRVRTSHPDYATSTRYLTVEGESGDLTVSLYTQQGELNPAWTGGVNPNPYTSIDDRPSVGIQPIGMEYEKREFPPRPSRDDADVITSSLSACYSALASASAGDVIWLEVDNYDVSDVPQRRTIPADVTLASDGARLFAPNGKNGIFDLQNDGARITGLRLEGDQATGSHNAQSIAMLVRADVLIDNCEMYWWKTTGAYVGWPSASNPFSEPTFRHCIIRDNRTDGYGYGIATYHQADPLIEYCFINNCREGLAGTGAPTSNYRAHNNLHGDAATLFAFEQHPDGGGRMEILNNEIRLVERNDGQMGRGYAQRGVPEDIAYLEHNWFWNPNPPDDNNSGASGTAISQTNHGSTQWINVEYPNNHYGADDPEDEEIGIWPLTRIGEEEPPDPIDPEPEPPDPDPGDPVPGSPAGRTRLSWSTREDFERASNVRGIIASGGNDLRVRDGILRLGNSHEEVARSALNDAVAYWPLNVGGVEPIGARSASLTNVETRRAGPLSTFASYFNGNARGRIPTAPAFRFSGGFTLSAIVCKTAGETTDTIIRNGLNEPGTWYFSLNVNDRIGFGYYNNSGVLQNNDGFHAGDATIGEWHHVAATFNPGTSQLRVRLNGTSESVSASGSRPSPPNNSDNDLYIGERGHPQARDRNFEGFMGHVALWNYPLSTSELDTLWAPLREGSMIDAPRTPQS